MQKLLYMPIDTTIDNTVECLKLIKRGDILKLQIKVFTNGVLTDLTGQSIDLILKKSDNTLIQNTIDISNIVNGVIVATLNVQATVIGGLVSGELQLSDGNGQSSTNTFTFNVTSSLADNVVEVSKNAINVLNDLRDLIATGEAELLEYKDNILAIANSIEAVEALGNIKSYIDTNLPLLESNNAEAIVNNNNLQNSIVQAINSKSVLDLSIEEANTFATEHGDIIDLDNRVIYNTAQLSDMTKQVKTFKCDDGQFVQGDGVHDDTTGIQRALNSFGSQTITNYDAQKFKGGKIEFPIGVYRITAPIFINDNTEIIGKGNFYWQSSFDPSSVSGTVFLCDFDSELSAINVVGLNRETNSYINTWTISGAEMQSGDFTYCDNVKITDLTIMTLKNVAIGIRGIGCTSISLNNCSVINFRNSIILSHCWGGSINKGLVMGKHTGIALMDNANGFSIRDTYITRTTDRYISIIDSQPYDINNRIITSSDFYSLDETPYAKTGLLVLYGNGVKIDNVIIERFERIGRMAYSSIEIANLSCEGITQTGIDFSQCTFDVHGGYVSTTSDIIAYKTAKLTKGSISNVLNIGVLSKFITSNAISSLPSININNCDVPLNEINTIDGININYSKLPIQENWKEPSLLNNWLNLGGFNPASYFKDSMGVIHLRGTLTSGSTTTDITLFILQDGYRPLSNCLFPCITNLGATTIMIYPSGEVILRNGGNSLVTLDGITFRP